MRYGSLENVMCDGLETVSFGTDSMSLKNASFECNIARAELQDIQCECHEVADKYYLHRVPSRSAFDGA